MRLMRALSATVEVAAAIALMRMNNTSAMLRLNSYLGMVGPFIFISVSALGLADQLGKIEPLKLLLVLGGVVMVALGTR
jgi:hypothetical protein